MLFTTLIVLTSMLTVALLIKGHMEQETGRLRTLGLFTAGAMAAAMEYALYVEDARLLAKTAAGLFKEEGVEYVVVRNAVFTPLAFAAPPDLKSPPPLPRETPLETAIFSKRVPAFGHAAIYEATVPVLSRPDPFLPDNAFTPEEDTHTLLLGYVQVGFSRTDLLIRQKGYILQLMAVMLLHIVIGTIAAAWIAHRFTSPLNELADAARDFGVGRLDRRVRVHGPDEVAQVARVFNTMAAHIEEFQQQQQQENLSRIATAHRQLLDEKDIRRKVEEELVIARQMESLGVLAGGIAHDFNNILTVILGNIALAKLTTEENDPVRLSLVEAEKACRRATDLTRQLLTFAKGGAPVKELASVTQVVLDTSRFVMRGSSSRLVSHIPDDLWHARMDPGQISQVIHNLVLNGIQAMPAGGELTVTCANEKLTAANQFSLAPGPYVRISVQDQGTGIPAQEISRIFTPYFTSKQQGSGLGLASAWSIVKKHDGHIDVSSRPGEGSLFLVYLPATTETPRGKAMQRLVYEAAAGARILVMDDQEDIRAMTVQMLQELGYAPTVAEDGESVILLYKKSMEEHRPFAAVVLDLTIPGRMGGEETAALIRELDADACLIVTSGYSDSQVMARHRDYGFREKLPKPFGLDELQAVLARALQKK